MPARSRAQTTSAARIYDAMLGGKTANDSDRRAAAKLAAAKPDIPHNVRANRAFLARCVRFIAGEAEVSQFLDIGTGLPSMNNTHEVAQRVNPRARIVYVDNDPEVLGFAGGLLSSTPAGQVRFEEADFNNPSQILALAAQGLDLREPVAILLVGILHLMQDSTDPYAKVAQYVAAAAAGSYLVITHPASDIHPEEAERGAKIYTQATGIVQRNRTHDEVQRFYEDLRLLPPGVVPVHQWRPQPGADLDLPVSTWAAVGSKP